MLENGLYMRRDQIKHKFMKYRNLRVNEIFDVESKGSQKIISNKNFDRIKSGDFILNSNTKYKPIVKDGNVVG